MVAHEGACARKAAQDCRPVAEAADSLVHLWQPAGTIYYDSEVLFMCCLSFLHPSMCGSPSAVFINAVVLYRSIMNAISSSLLATSRRQVRIDWLGALER